MKTLSKILSLIISTALVFTLFTGCDDYSDDSNSANYLKGTEAAKLLLANTRLNENFADDKIISLPSYSSEISLTSNVTNGEIVKLTDDRVGIDYTTKGFSLTDIEASWSNFVKSSNVLQAMYATIINTESNAVSVAELFSKIKANANITDMWLPIQGKTMLKVRENDEIVLQELLNNEKGIYRRFINDQGKNEYEWVNIGNNSTLHIRYVLGSYYELMYRYNDFLDWFIIDNSRGYWNCMRLSELDYEGDEDDCYQISNAILAEDMCIEFTISCYKNGTNTVSIIRFIEPDLSTDIIGVGFDEFNQPKSIFLEAGAFKGLQKFTVPIEKLNYFDYAEGTQTPIPLSDNDVSIVLSNGNVYNHNDTVIKDKVEYIGSFIDFEFQATYGNMDYKYVGESMFTLLNATSLTDAVNTVVEMSNELNLQPQFNVDNLIKTASVAEDYIDNFYKYYKWNGYSLNNYATIKNAIEVVSASKTAEYGKIYDDNINAPSITEEELKELLTLNPVAKFGKVSNYYDGNVELKNGVITVSGATASVNDFTYFDLNKSYKINYGIAKVKEENVANTSLVGNFGNVQLVSSTQNIDIDEVWLLPLGNGESSTLCAMENYVGGTAMNFTQSGSYTLPNYLSDGKYVFVSYIAEAESGIRVTDYNTVTFGLAEKQTIEHELGTYVAEKDDNGNLKFTAETRLDVTVKLEELKSSYTYDEVYELVYISVLSNGLPQLNAVLEVYDQETQTYVANSDKTKIFTTEKVRLKFLRKTPLGNEEAYAYVELKIQT